VKYAAARRMFFVEKTAFCHTAKDGLLRQARFIEKALAFASAFFWHPRPESNR